MALGPDGVTAMMLRLLPASAQALLQIVFNISLCRASFPELLKRSYLVTLPKCAFPTTLFSYANIRECYDVHVQLISSEYLLFNSILIYGHSKSFCGFYNIFVHNNLFWAFTTFTIFGAHFTTSKLSLPILDG